MGREGVAPIAATDLDRVGEFLNKNLNGHISGADWARAARVPWPICHHDHAAERKPRQHALDGRHQDGGLGGMDGEEIMLDRQSFCGLFFNILGRFVGDHVVAA